MTKPSYFELLKHPLWQKKRLEILQLHGFACQCCGDKQSSLHVHHGYYERNKMPWEYENESLHCLCANCHDQAEIRLNLVRKLVGVLTSGSVDQALGYLLALGLESSISSGKNYAWVKLRNYPEIIGLADYYRVSPDDLMHATEHDGWLSRERIIALPKQHVDEEEIA